MTEHELKQYLQTHYPKENTKCEWKEFKSLKSSVSGRQGDDIISYVSGIANMEGGHLVIGIEDETHNIIGIQDSHNYTPENLPFRLVGNCPNLSSEGLIVEEFITSDSQKKVWVLHIPKHSPRLPIYAHRKKWQRIGDNLLELTKERENTIIREPLNDGHDWSAQIIESATLDDLDSNAINFARKKYIEKYNNEEEVNDWDDITFLNKAYITKQSKITNTAILLLGKPESKHFLEPAQPLITWVLRNDDKEELSYDHFHLPFVLASDKIYGKIRNLKYVYLQDNTLFPTEIDMYDSFIIRESLHNCIAHQDYEQGRRINVVEYPNTLIFTNAGSFIPGTVENVIEQDSPPDKYRNPFLATAMTNLKMIEIRGGGIRKMFTVQRKRFFPMPDYDFSKSDTIKVTIFGKILDENYTKLLKQRNDLNLKTVILLDYIQKNKTEVLTQKQIKFLKQEKLIEGRKPNYFVSANIADATNQRAEYMKNRGINDEYAQKMILDYLQRFEKGGKRSDFEGFLLEKFSDLLSSKQKKNKVKNILQKLKTTGKIELKGQKWFLLK